MEHLPKVLILIVAIFLFFLLRLRRAQKNTLQKPKPQVISEYDNEGYNRQGYNEVYQFGKSKLQLMKSERGIIEEKEQQYGDSVILIYRGFCYVFTENNGLKTVYKNDRART